MPSSDEKKKASSNKKVKILSQGSYGCIFRPGFQCNGRILKTKKYITKIQKKKKTSDNEVLISEKVREIPHFGNYFAPIIENPCAIDLNTIKTDEIKKCEFLSTPEGETKFESNRIRYVGKRTISEQMFYYYKKQPKQIIKKLVESNLHLLKGFDLLNKKGIIHFDVKENNIMCSDKTGIPIIIDFGLSIDVSTMSIKNFFAYGPEYEPWCIDIQFITYMAKNRKDDVQTAKIEQSQIDTIIADFFEKNNLINQILTESERSTYRNDLTAWFSTKYGANAGTITWQTVMDDLIKFKETWDGYSVAVIYLYLIHDMELEKYGSQIPKLLDYFNYLKQLFMSMPDKRPTAEQSIASIKQIFSKIPQIQKKNVQELVAKDSSLKDFQINVYKKINLSKVAHLKQEEQMMMKMKKQ